MPAYVPAASREASKLQCSLLKASKQGDRVVKPPERYSSMDWSVKPQRATQMRAVTVKKKKATCMRSISSRTQETPRSHDRYLHGDADVGLMSKSQVKKVFKEAMKVQPGNIESRLSEGEPNADEEEEEAVTEEGSINLVNVSTQSTIEQSMDPGARVGVVDENTNNQPFAPIQHQATRTQQNSNFSQLPADAANQIWRRIGADFGAESLHGVPSFYNPFNHQTNPYMSMMTTPYRFQSALPYYTPMTSYMNTPYCNPMYTQHNYGCSPCQRYRERFVTEIATTMLTSLLDKAANFECCHEQYPDMSGGASRSVSTATIPALQSSSLDQLDASSNVNGLPRPEALYEN